MKTVSQLMLTAACLVCLNSPVNAEEKVAPEVQDKLCRLAIQDNSSAFLGTLNATDIRLFANYRNVYCAAEGGFDGGSLLKAADHFQSKKVFDVLIQYIRVDDIFWEFSTDENKRRTRIYAYKN